MAGSVMETYFMKAETAQRKIIDMANIAKNRSFGTFMHPSLHTFRELQ